MYCGPNLTCLTNLLEETIDVLVLHLRHQVLILMLAIADPKLLALIRKCMAL